MYNESVLKGFCKDCSLPIQIYDPEYVSYYINLYDPFYLCKEKFVQFEQTISQFDSINAFKEYKSKLKNSVIQSIKDTPAYQTLQEDDLDIKFPVKKEVRTIPYSKTINIYNQHNIGKYFLSIDLCKANYQALKLYNPEIVLNSNSYDELLKQFTSHSYLIQSKYIRQFIFGNLNMNRIVRLERWITQTLLEYLLVSKRFEEEDIVAFTTDELIIKLDRFMEPANCHELAQLIKIELGIDVHVESFKLSYLGNTFYLKEHSDTIPTFKGGSSIYFTQAVKHYLELPLEDKDLCFSYEGHIAKFLEPLKWNE